MSDQDVASPKPSLLIVDDDKAVIIALSRTFEGIARIRFATNGLDALSMIERDLPDLVLLDMEMPGMDGLAVCRALKASPLTADVPIVFITSNDELDAEERIFAVGASDYVHKPLNPVVVTARVNIHLAYRAAIARLGALATRDGLTSLSNRRAFDEKIGAEFARSKRNKSPLAILLIDVDDFKKYNDQFGHTAGDECLKAIATSLARSVRRPADLVARYGGEEFAVILPDTDAEGARAIGEMARKNIELLHLASAEGAHHHFVTVSIGGCAYHPDGDVAIELVPVNVINSADGALYQSKAAGKNRVAMAPDFG